MFRQVENFDFNALAICERIAMGSVGEDKMNVEFDRPAVFLC